MNSVPVLFADSVIRLLECSALRKLQSTGPGLFSRLSRVFFRKRLILCFNVVYNVETNTFDYSLGCRGYETHGTYGMNLPYTYDRANHQFFYQFDVILHKDNRDMTKYNWTNATPSDPTLLKWLRTPIARTSITFEFEANYPEFLKLLPDFCTFNFIDAWKAHIPYNDALDTIIQRSLECGRLEEAICAEFFTTRDIETCANLIARNKRLTHASHTHWSCMRIPVGCLLETLERGC